MLLPVEWEIFGIALFVSMLSLWIDLRFREKNIDVSEGSSFFCKAFIHPSDAGKTIEVDLGSKQSVFVIDAAHVIFLLFALRLSGQAGSAGRVRKAKCRCGPGHWLSSGGLGREENTWNWA